MFSRDRHANVVRTLIIRFVLAVSLGLLIADQSQAQNNPSPKAPRGWSKSTAAGKHPNVSFTHDAIKSPDYLAVKFYNRKVLVDQTVPQWIEERLITGAAPLDGKWSGPIENLSLIHI